MNSDSFDTPGPAPQSGSESAAARFEGLRVAAFESRQRGEMARLIERFGGLPFVSASMREAPLADSQALVDFAHRLVTGQVDVMIFLTGVGFEQLLAAVERHVDRGRFLNALSDITTVCRGPKPTAAMKGVGLSPTYKVPEPNTWRELLTTLDANVRLANQTVALQEYGVTNPSLIAGLEARGANVQRVKVYDWELPLDVGPLRENVRAMCAGERDVLLFTAAHQVTTVMRVADDLGHSEALREAMGKVVVCSIGPTTSDMLRESDWPVDVIPEHPKMGHLVQAAAERSREILARKKRVARLFAEAARPKVDPQAPWFNSLFLKACRREPVSTTPVWLMRQAGRYMQEYREVRGKTTFLELCKNPSLCSEVMCTAVKRLGVDAAIIFSDLLPILEPMGLSLEFAQGEGPVIHNPVREAGDVDRVLELESMESLSFVLETVKQTRADLPAEIPLIGFAGAPFTLASYVIEGGASRNYLNTKTLMYRDRGAWRTLMQRLSRSIGLYLNAQIAAGCQAVQIFDSWAGCLSPADYREFVLPYMQEIIAGIAPGTPVINFATGNPALLPLLAAGYDNASQVWPVVGVDWRIGLDEAWRTVGPQKAVQGNLDPAVLLAGRDEISRHTQAVLDAAGGRTGHIFNLGHGVHQQTPVENAAYLVELVHERRLG